MKIQGDFGVIALYIYIYNPALYKIFFQVFYDLYRNKYSIQNIIDSNLLYSKIRIKELIFLKPRPILWAYSVKKG